MRFDAADSFGADSWALGPLAATATDMNTLSSCGCHGAHVPLPDLMEAGELVAMNKYSSEAEHEAPLVLKTERGIRMHIAVWSVGAAGGRVQHCISLAPSASDCKVVLKFSPTCFPTHPPARQNRAYF